MSGTSPELLRNILAQLAAMGTDYIQLNKFATHQRAHSAGLVLQAYLGALQNYLQCYRAAVLSVEGLYALFRFLSHSSFCRYCQDLTYQMLNLPDIQFSRFGLPNVEFLRFGLPY